MPSRSRADGLFGQAGHEGGVGLVRIERDSEDGRERRERAVDEADHGRLDALEEKMMLVALTGVVYRTNCQVIEHKAHHTKVVRSA